MGKEGEWDGAQSWLHTCCASSREKLSAISVTKWNSQPKSNES